MTDEEKVVLLDIVGFSPERARGIEQRFGRVVLSWDEVETWDDVVTSHEKAVIEEVRARRQRQEGCAFLGQEGEFFHYCDAQRALLERIGYEETRKPSLRSSQYRAKVGHFELQLYCMDPERFCNCMRFRQAMQEVGGERHEFVVPGVEG